MDNSFEEEARAFDAEMAALVEKLMAIFEQHSAALMEITERAFAHLIEALPPPAKPLPRTIQ